MRRGVKKENDRKAPARDIFHRGVEQECFMGSAKLTGITAGLHKQFIHQGRSKSRKISKKGEKTNPREQCRGTG